MGSKGVNYYVYIGANNFTVNINYKETLGKDTRDINLTYQPNQGVAQIQMGSFEINSNFWTTEMTGRVAFTVNVNGKGVVSKFIEIQPTTGNISDTWNNDPDYLNDMRKQTSVFGSDYAVSYGFVDNGTNTRDQLWIYVTANHENWLGGWIKKNPALRNAPFSTLVLPGSHDAGMFTSDFFSLVGQSLNNTALEKAIEAKCQWQAEISTLKTIWQLSITQKDNILSQLQLGTRFFDYRPAYYTLDQKLRHVHNFVPGYLYESFLSDVVDFLNGHPQEIVVLGVSQDGVCSVFKPFSKSDTTTLAGSIIRAKGYNIQTTDESALDEKTTIDTLLSTNKRLVIIDKSFYQNDSYNGDTYKTENPDNIVGALTTAIAPTIDTTNNKIAKGKYFFQLQGTLSADTTRAINQQFVQSDTNTPLLYTKPIFDAKTYPWIAERLSSGTASQAKVASSSPVVLLNDFVDNALTDYALSIVR